MTINVSLKVPDGIVIACDSLATSLMPLQAKFQVAPLKCSQCGHEQPVGPIQMPPIGVPFSSTPLASKLFYINNYGLTFFGASSINGRSLFNHVMVFRTTIYKTCMNMFDIADGLAAMLAEAIKNDKSIDKNNSDLLVAGFQICGYDEVDIDFGRTSVVYLFAGKPPKREDMKQEYGVTVTGQNMVVNFLFQNPPNGVSPKPNFTKMTLADAIDYARFLVQTTSDYHRFMDAVPTVGGPTEVALITKWIGFRWVDRKKILGDDTTRINVGKISQEINQIRQDLPEIIRQSRQNEHLSDNCDS